MIAEFMEMGEEKLDVSYLQLISMFFIIIPYIVGLICHDDFLLCSLFLMTSNG